MGATDRALVVALKVIPRHAMSFALRGHNGVHPSHVQKIAKQQRLGWELAREV